MFIGQKKYRLMLAAIAELEGRVGALEEEKARVDEEAEKEEKLFREGLSNVMNYSLETLKRGEKLG